MKKRTLKQTAFLLALFITCHMALADTLVFAAGQTEAGQAFFEEFEDPSVSEDTVALPTMRWWIPPTADESRIREEVREIAAAGYGGAEIVPFNLPANHGADTSVYAWGTPNWASLMKVAHEEAALAGLKLDHTISLRWPVSSPHVADTSDPAAEVTLNTYRSDLLAAGEQTVNVPAGTIENSKLMSAVLVKMESSHVGGAVYDFDSIVQISAEDIEGTGMNLTASVTVPEDGGYYLFGNWEEPTERMQQGVFYITDHYGMAGTEAIIKYWEEDFIPAVGEEVFRSSARSIFCDSLEQRGRWSRDFVETFKQEKGYDISPYLFLYPGLDHREYRLFSSALQRLSDTDKNEAILRDMFDVLTTCYIEYHLKPIREFCHKYGMTLRYQTSYGQTLELARTAVEVDIPEGESMMIRNLIDNFRSQAGAVHLSGKKLYTAEVQAESPKNYVQDWDDFLWIMQRQWVGGINNLTMHGLSYRGDFSGEDANPDNGYVDGIVWPGYESFGRTSFSNNWNRLPSWEHINDYTDYISRNDYVLQQGAADVDIAVYRNDYMDNIRDSVTNNTVRDGKYIYRDGGELERAGFTYDFVSPANLDLESAVVTDGVLAADGPSYKAMIIQFQNYMPTETAKKILGYAEAGLPVVFVGAAPAVTGNAMEDNGELLDTIDALTALPNVRQVSGYDDVPVALSVLSVEPDSLFAAKQEVLTAHRRDEGVDFYFVYNFGRVDNTPRNADEAVYSTITPVDFNVSFIGQGVPFLLDSWTGDVTPIAEYSVEGDRITLNIALDTNESQIIAFAAPEWGGLAQTDHAEAGTDGDVFYDETGALTLRATETGDVEVTLAGGRNETVTVSEVEAPIELTEWTLSVKDYNPGETPIETVFETIDIGETTLKSWTEIPGLEYAAGIGTYTAAFSLENSWADGTGAVLDLGRVQDSFRVTINGNAITGNRYTSRMDIGQYLVSGENTLVVEVATTLINKLAGVIEGEIRTTMDYGLIGPVVVTPYTKTAVPVGN